MDIRMFRQFILPAVLCAKLVLIPLPSAGESGAAADDAARAARELVEDLVNRIAREHRDLHGEALALHPLKHKKFHGLNKWDRWRLHELLVVGLESVIGTNYKLISTNDFIDISDILEEQGESDWFERFEERLRESNARINIVCEASPPSKRKFQMTCAASTSDPGMGIERLATGTGEFRMDWLTRLMDPEPALDSLAEEINSYMQGDRGPGNGGGVKVSSKDWKTRSQTVLSAYIAKRLLDKLSEKQRSWHGWRFVDGAKGEAGDHRVKVEVWRFQEKLDLRVVLSTGTEDKPLTSFGRSMHWTDELEELRELDGAAGEPVAGGECEEGADPGERMLVDEPGRKLKDWALLTDHQLNTGGYDYGDLLEVLVKAKTYLAEHCEWDRVAKIMDAVISGLAQELGAAIERGARTGLEQLLAVEESAGRHLALLRLRARAYELLEDRREQDRAYTEILEIAPDDPAVRLPILEAQDRIRIEIGREDAENALGLGGSERSLVRRGLSSFGFDVGEGPAELDKSFRAVLRSWQSSKGYLDTGYLTREQVQALMAEGRAAQERERAERAFARAKAADTEASYAAYLAKYPSGEHAAEAERRMKAARAREDEARARAAAEMAERDLALGTEDRALVERGLASSGGDRGEVDGRFDAAFRAVLRSWQSSKGYLDTGYLTREQVQALMAEGRVAQERERAERAFARAKAADTEASYAAYLAEYPSGEHAAEAERRMKAARAREDEARARAAAEMAERDLALGAEDRALVERGLASSGGDSGEVDGRFDAAFRSALRSWQSSKGYLDTGYLTAEQVQALVAEGRVAQERERVERAFARAKAADTEASYAAYLAEYPSGEHAAEAERRMKVARAKEKIERERAQCMAADRSRLTEGTVFCDCAKCPVMVVGAGGVATSKYPVRAFEYMACIDDGVCAERYGIEPLSPIWWANRVLLRGKSAQMYVDWLSRKTGKRYRALPEGGGSHDPSDGEEGLFSGGYSYLVARNIAGDRAAAVETRLRLSHSDRMLIQRALNALGFDVGVVDGVFGRRTRGGIVSYQREKGLAETGYLTREQYEGLVALGEEAQRQVEETRAERERQEAEAERQEAERRAEAAARRRGPAVGERFRDCDGTWCPELVVVPSGSFMMGSPSSEAGRANDEGPLHRVRIAERFAVGVTEVTRGQWSVFVSETGHSTGDSCWTYESGEWNKRSGRSWRNPGYSQSDGHPVVCVSWEDAQAYVGWLSRKTGKSYRLLSESEWEYVARAGTSTARYWGEGEANQCRHVNGADRMLKERYGDSNWTTAGCRDGHVHTAPVGSFEANGYGLHDVLGNVGEWTMDCKNQSYAGSPTDGSAWESGDLDCGWKVSRGGSWSAAPMYLRSAFRSRGSAGLRMNDDGFRVARTLTP